MDDAITGVIEIMEHMSDDERLQVFDLVADFFMLDDCRRCDLLMLSENLAAEFVSDSSAGLFIKAVKDRHLN